MLGNDVVDLTVDTQKHLNQRFVKRTLTPHEQLELQRTEDKNLFLWSLWSIKEASYKACQKLDHQLLFSPIQYELDSSDLRQLSEHDPRKTFNGNLIHQTTKLRLQLSWLHSSASVKINHSFAAVHATAVEYEESKPLRDVQVSVTKMKQLSTYKNQSSEVRKLAASLLASNDIFATIQRPPVMIKDYSKPGPPVLINADQSTLPHEISLSHDNNWLAVALLIK